MQIFKWGKSKIMSREFYNFNFFEQIVLNFRSFKNLQHFLSHDGISKSPPTSIADVKSFKLFFTKHFLIFFSSFLRVKSHYAFECEMRDEKKSPTSESDHIHTYELMFIYRFRCLVTDITTDTNSFWWTSLSVMPKMRGDRKCW